MSGKILVLELLPKIFRLQNSGFLISVKKLRDQADFLFADKYQVCRKISEFPTS